MASLNFVWIEFEADALMEMVLCLVYLNFGFLMPCDGIRVSLVQRIGLLGTKGLFFDCCYMQQMFQSLS